MRNKRKGILMASAILGSAAIVSTGFAAWVVTYNETETVEGNIQVDEVVDKTHLIEVKNENLNVHFGKTTKTASYNWLTNESQSEQVLEASFTVEVTNFATANLNVSIDTPDGFDVTRDNKRLLADPAIELGSSTLSAISEGSKTGQVTITITFNWGEYFNGQNPINFYNAIENPTTEIRTGVSYATDAIETLGLIHELNSKKYVVTLSTTDGNGSVTKS